MVHRDAWLRPSLTLQTTPVTHENDLPSPGNTSSGQSHQHILLWEAPDSFLGNKVAGNSFLPVCHCVCLSACLPVSVSPVFFQLVSYGGYLNYTLIYDVPLDNEFRSVPAHTDIIIKVRKNGNYFFTRYLNAFCLLFKKCLYYRKCHCCVKFMVPVSLSIFREMVEYLVCLLLFSLSSLRLLRAQFRWRWLRDGLWTFPQVTTSPVMTCCQSSLA